MTFDEWFTALESRHLADLTRPELTRALRALSSCYVERREKLAGGAALEGAGKRAAFALFYGPMHFLTVSAIARELRGSRRLDTIHDIGCGTGVGGAAWALAGGGTRDAGREVRVAGIDRNPWAVAEANWTYRQLGVHGHATAGDAVTRFPHSHISRLPDSAILLAYSANEIPEPARTALLDRVSAAVEQGAALLVVEPIAKKDRGWWTAWAARLAPAGVVEREWRFPADLPQALRQIAKSAGLDPRELTARTLSST
jgi:hypothetical protein